MNITMMLSPDNAHGFQPIDRGVASKLAARLGATSEEYAASFISSAPSSGPGPDMLQMIVNVPYRGTRFRDVANAALRDAQEHGYGGFEITPESAVCTAAADRLGSMRSAQPLRIFVRLTANGLSRSTCEVRSPSKAGACRNLRASARRTSAALRFLTYALQPLRASRTAAVS